MGIIRQLDYETAVLVAAGEMIERPASVVKELVENSIDAGASKLTVEIQGGGIKLIRVSDNGCGIAKEDLPVAIKRNATSKIRTCADISTILTLGFRGEALASIAACSDLRIRSKRPEDEVGNELSVSPDMGMPTLTEAPMANGTTIIVENLFSNIPARRKFLKKDSTEASHISDLFEKLALSNPAVAMTLIIDGKPKFTTPGDGDLRHTIYSIKGADFASKLIELDYHNDVKIYGGGSVSVTIKGFIGTPENNQGIRSNQVFFVNGRSVRSKCLQAALEESYTSYLEASRFPACVMFVEMPPEFVDVNIHPTKLEVKFVSDKPIFEAVYYAVRGALEKFIPRPTIDFEGKNINEVNYELYKMLNAFVPLSDNSEPKTTRPVYNNQRNVKVGQLSINDAQTELSPNPEPMPAPRANTHTPEMPASPIPRNMVEYELVQRDKPSDNKNITQEVFLEEIPPELDRTMSAERGRPVDSQKMYLGEIASEVDELLSSPKVKSVRPDKVPSLMSDEEFAELRRACAEQADSDISPRLPDMPTPEEVHREVEAAYANIKKKVPEYKIIGEVFLSYVLLEVGDKLMIIDKHAAHERIIFEELRANMKRKFASGDSPRQLLLTPLEIPLAAAHADTVGEYAEDINAIGFDFALEGVKVNITAIPAELETAQATEVFETVIDRLAEGTGSAAITRETLFEKALYQASCKAAIKIGREYDAGHLKYICDKLMVLDDIKVCPHGRPVAFEMTKSTIERQFKRI